ncbi:glycosyltransferase family 4 protein [Chloroflexota bacterium]
MKIVIITPYWLQTKGGITTVAYCLFNEVKNMDHLVWVLTPDGGSEAIRLPGVRPFMMLATIKRLWGIKPDVIHVHAHGSLLLAPVIYKVLCNRRARVVFTFHTQPPGSSFFAGKQSRKRGRLRLAALNCLLGCCDTTTFVSRNLKESLEATGIRITNSVVIPNGVEVKRIAPGEAADFKQKYDLLQAYPVLCMVSVLQWDWKANGVEIMIKAFKSVLASQPVAKLLIVGDGQYRKILEDYTVKEGLKRQVVFTGNMDNPFIALSVCDIYCHISLNEALPIAPLEAMSAGKPVVASNDGGLPEIITSNENGILVESKPEAVAGAILSLMKQPEVMARLASAARRTTRDKFAWSKVTAEYLKVYGGHPKITDTL